MIQRLWSLIGIKPNATVVVKRACSRDVGTGFLLGIFILVTLCTGPFSFGQEPATSTAPPDTPPPQEAAPPTATADQNKNKDQDDAGPDDEEHPPQIEAKTFNVRVSRRSNSNRIYLIEITSEGLPTEGRILLLKHEGEQAMAFRVMRVYPDKKLVAARRVRKYKKYRLLQEGDEFLAVEKIADYFPPPPTPPVTQEVQEMNDFEKKFGLKPRYFDPELDAGTSQTPPSQENEEDKDLDEPYAALSVEETTLIDRHRHWITAGFGYVRNNGPPGSGGSSYFQAANMRYGLTVSKLLLVNQPHLQDSLTLETGFYLYKSLSFVTTGDSYTTMSLLGSVRYNLFFSEAFGVFVYGGILNGFVLASNSSQPSGLAALNSIQPAVGTGVLFQVGPNWYTRVDIGIDSITLNLLLKI